MEIKSLANIDFDTLFRAFARAFADYELQQDKTQLQSMLKRRGFDPELSFAAFEGDRIVAFTFNGIGLYNGIPTAYDTGTGTLKEYRSKGLATAIFEYSIPHLKKANLKQYLLEVLQHNTKAVSVYRNLGFETTREFNYFIQENAQVINPVSPLEPPYWIKPILLQEHPVIPGFWDFQPSWQNSTEAIQRSPENFVSLGIFTGNKLVGYCVFELASGDVTQLAVDKNHRRKGIASYLLREMLRFNKSNIIKVINTDLSCDAITGFLEAKNICLKGKQFEMVKAL